MSEMFRALLLNQGEDKKITAAFDDVTTDDLPAGEVLVKVAYSSLNYKDGLAVTGKGKIARSFPMVPGIDFAGTVVSSAVDAYTEGQAVILTGWGVGEKHWGGYAAYARVPAAWLVPLPAAFTAQQAMGVGTAGFTAMLAVIALENAGLCQDDGEVLVTGASGGVGSVAVALLAELGYTVVASTGREAVADYLKGLGASEVVGRFASPGRPLASGRWAGAVDGVGGDTLAAILPEMAYGASVAVYGLAGGTALNTTVLPFILRGVNLLGVDSVMCPKAPRTAAWERLAQVLPTAKLDTMMQVEPLSNVLDMGERILAGDVRGRVVLDVEK